MRPSLLLWLLALQAPVAGRLTPAGVVRAQAIVDSVFLNRTAMFGSIEGGDWASYLMARLGVNPLPDSAGVMVAVDSSHLSLSGRIQDLPAEAQAMLGPLAALVEPSTMLIADVVLLPTGKGLAHFQLRGVSVGGFPVPEMVLRSMLFTIGDRYPALTSSGRDLFVQMPVDGSITLVPGAVRLTAPPAAAGSSPPF